MTASEHPTLSATVARMLVRLLVAIGLQVATPAAAETVSTQDLLWSMRSGLNVAALQCGDAVLTGRYNLLLRRHAPSFAAAYAAQQAKFKHQYPADWQGRFDAALTRQFNAYALLPDRAAYCRWAARLAGDLANRAPGELDVLAAAQR